MKAAYIIRYVGMVLLLNAAFMFVAALISFFNGMDTGFYPLLLSFIITAIIGFFPMIFVPKDRHISSKEGYIIVLASWIASCLMGMLPYIIWGGEFTVVNAWFESTSGYSTTGSTILTDVEALPRSLLFWRAATHWIGGVGVVMFALVILPSIARQKIALSSVEMSSMAKDNFRYNSKKILKIILFVYVGLTAAEVFALAVVGMDWFDAVAHSFSTMATGGFSTKNLSILYFDNIWIEVVISIFMVLAGMHFGLIYATLRGRSNSIFKSEVSRYYILSLTICGLLVVLNLWTTGTYDNVWSALRYGLFQTISYSSTTGFASIDNALWPSFTILALTVLSIQCAMAGSTSGGMKADRVLLLFKAIKVRTLKIQHPSAVMRVKLGGHTQDDQIVSTAVLLIGFYLLVLVVSTAFLSIWGIDLMTSFTASVASLGNVGPGFGEVSNLANLDFFNPAIKIWLSIMMLFGRLELFGLIHLFMLRSWR